MRLTVMVDHDQFETVSKGGVVELEIQTETFLYKLDLLDRSSGQFIPAIALASCGSSHLIQSESAPVRDICSYCWRDVTDIRNGHDCPFCGCN